jgi:hypothetical protein
MRHRVERRHKLHCDSCHEEVEIDRVSLAWVDTPCPVCQSNMLPEEDFREYCRVEHRLVWMERFARFLNFFGLLPAGGLSRTTIKHGETVTRLREGSLL